MKQYGCIFWCKWTRFSAVAIGRSAGQTNQLSGSVAIGGSAGKVTQGAGSVAVGIGAGANNQGSRVLQLVIWRDI